MVQAFTPSNDVELSIFTTETSWSTEEIETKPIDDNFWKTLRFLKRDLRLGNLQAKYDDYEWLDNQVQLVQNILSLRDGYFDKIAPMALIRVVAAIELSQSRGGFLRQWFRTFNINSKESEANPRGGGLFGMFGGRRP